MKSFRFNFCSLSLRGTETWHEPRPASRGSSSRMSRGHTSNFLLVLTLFVVSYSCESFSKDSVKLNEFNQSVSIQIGLNGNLSDSQSYGLQLLPPDLSYSREIFKINDFNLSTSTFYDNIGVKISDANFKYRIGQRVDIVRAFNLYSPYLTIGLGSMRTNNNYQTSLVYGAGLLMKISKRFSLVNEINFQNVHHQSKDYNIVNLSTGMVYNF